MESIVTFSTIMVHVDFERSNNACLPIAVDLAEQFGAKLIGTETEVILKSRNAVPKRLLGEGFRFAFTKPGTAI